MPTFAPLTVERVQEITTRGTKTHSYDPTEYVAYVTEAAKPLDDGQKYGGGMFEIDPSDNVRALKRRTTTAAKTIPNVVLKWKNQREENGKAILEFLVMRPESVVKRPRKAANIQTSNPPATDTKESTKESTPKSTPKKSEPSNQTTNKKSGKNKKAA